MNEEDKRDRCNDAIETAHSVINIHSDINHTTALAQTYATLAIAHALRDIRDEIKKLGKET